MNTQANRSASHNTELEGLTKEVERTSTFTAHLTKSLKTSSPLAKAISMHRSKTTSADLP